MIIANKEKPLPETQSLRVEFKNHSLLPMLYGEQDANLSRIEKKLHIEVASRGNALTFNGEASAVAVGKIAVESLYHRLEQGKEVNMAEVDAAIRMAQGDATNAKKKRPPVGGDELAIKTLKKVVQPYSHVQADYVKALFESDLVFGLGPAGTGKTYLAVAMAVYMFINRKVDRIILSRPAVEAGEKLGFLPGDLKEKVDPYLRPLYDALYDMIPGERVIKMVETGEVEVAPLAFMRGRTLANSYIILDEAQNTTPTQMKMFLTRLGENSRMVVTGDMSQIDLPKDVKSGLRDALNKIEHIEGIKCIRFSDVDVVRHDLAAKIVQAYDEWDKKKGKN